MKPARTITARVTPATEMRSLLLADDSGSIDFEARVALIFRQAHTEEKQENMAGNEIVAVPS